MPARADGVRVIRGIGPAGWGTFSDCARASQKMRILPIRSIAMKTACEFSAHICLNQSTRRSERIPDLAVTRPHSVLPIRDRQSSDQSGCSIHGLLRTPRIPAHPVESVSRVLCLHKRLGCGYRFAEDAHPEFCRVSDSTGIGFDGVDLEIPVAETNPCRVCSAGRNQPEKLLNSR